MNDLKVAGAEWEGEFDVVPDAMTSESNSGGNSSDAGSSSDDRDDGDEGRDGSGSADGEDSEKSGSYDPLIVTNLRSGNLAPDVSDEDKQEESKSAEDEPPGDVNGKFPMQENEASDGDNQDAYGGDQFEDDLSSADSDNSQLHSVQKVAASTQRQRARKRRRSFNQQRRQSQVDIERIANRQNARNRTQRRAAASSAGHYRLMSQHGLQNLKDFIEE